MRERTGYARSIGDGYHGIFRIVDDNAFFAAEDLCIAAVGFCNGICAV